MTQSPTGPQPSRLPTPQYRSTHLRVRTHIHTSAHTCPHTPSSPAPPKRRTGARRARLGHCEVGGAGRRGPTGAVTADAVPHVLSANSLRPPRFPEMPRPRRLPFREETSSPLTARRDNRKPWEQGEKKLERDK
ncbi:hypothetical protein H1C71_038001 [Ictidomys tridecemlineatus]|nr:hypothetical protein H1C71_038001 [Ictidomys tridecemlineatus]